MLVVFFLIFIAGAVGTLYFGFFQKERRWLLTMISTVLWAVLAFQAFKIEVPSGGVTLVFQEIIVVLFCWFMTFVGAVITGIGILDTLKTNKQEAQHG